MAEKKLRDVLFTPWRFLYIKKGRDKVQDVPCVFCDAVQKDVNVETLVLYKGKYCSVILNKYPYNNGHTMVIPNNHVAELPLLPQEAYLELNDLLLKTYSAIKDSYKPGGLNIGMNIGRTGGAGIVDHLHYHIVPRWDGDSNFMPIIAGTKVVSESPETTYERLKPYYE
ncbi:MAG: HIT domain-containing protein [Oligoflexia bacterium]|nr:HIT domain-containing protein [Oligoflexia bacterium]